MTRIGREEAWRKLTEVDPMLRRKYEDALVEWAGYPFPDTVVMAEIAVMLSREINDGFSERLASIFSEFEGLMRDGDEQTRTIVATGFIEALVTETDHGRVRRETVNKYLGREMRSYWNAWDAFMLGGKAQPLAQPEDGE